MYHLVMFDVNKVVQEIRNNLTDVIVEGRNVSWRGGSIDGINLDFIVIDSSFSVEIGSVLTDEHLQADKKHSLKSEMELMKDQLRDTQSVIDFLLGL